MNVGTPGTSMALGPAAASVAAPGASAADGLPQIAAPVGADAVAEALKRGPIGALTVSIIAISLLLLGWILFYFLLFLGRGPVG